MEVVYSEEVEVIRVFFREARTDVASTIEATPYVQICVDAEGRPVSIRLMGVSQFVDKPDQVTLKELPKTVPGNDYSDRT